MIKIGTVCSGIGSPEVAIHQLAEEKKFEVEKVFACDIDKYARDSYLANFKTKEMFTDMTSEEFHNNAGYSDIFIGGIPCQAFSLAGKRLGELDKRGLLFYDFYRYVREKQPKVFIIENVKGLISDNKGKTFQNWLLLLGRSVNQHEQMFLHPDSLEYNLHHTVLNSKNFGVPQNRERVFIVGIRNDLLNNFSFPVGWPLDKRLKDILEPKVDEKYYLSDKMVEGLIKTKNKSFINQDTQASQVYDVDNLAPTLAAGTHGYANGYIEEVNNADPQIINPLKDKTDFGWHFEQNVFSEDSITRALKSSEGSGNKQKVILKNRIRRLTPLECWRLQGFPDENLYKAKEFNSDTQLYKQAGNSMTTKVMKAIIKNTLPILL